MQRFLGFLLVLIIVVLGATLMVESPARAQDATTPTPEETIEVDEDLPRVVEDVDEVQLSLYDGPYTQVVEELQELGLAPWGGSLVFQSGYIYYDGQGDRFVALAYGKPHVNIIVGADLSLREGETDEDNIQECGIIMRIGSQSGAADGSGDARFWMFTGVDNKGNAFLQDRYTDADPIYINRKSLDLEVGEPHDLIITLIDDRATVYIRGELAFVVENLDPRNGYYGVSITGDGFGARCNAYNMWIYEIDRVWDGEAGFCGITVNQAVNLRAGPGVNFELKGEIKSGDVLDVDGQIWGRDGFIWWRTTDETWVRSDFVRELGPCEDEAPLVELDEQIAQMLAD